jgi:hypothetical protein
MNPGPILTIRNTFSTHLHTLLFSATFYSKNKKNIFTFSHTQPKPKNTITTSYLLYCIVIYFIAFVIIFYFTYIYTLCLTTTRWGWGHKTRKLFCIFLEEERAELFLLFSESLILNPEFSRGENFLLHSALGVPTSWHLCSVSSKTAVYGEFGSVTKRKTVSQPFRD